MATFIFKNAIFNVSQSSTTGPSIPLRPKVSRVSFTTSSTKYPQRRNAVEGDGKGVIGSVEEKASKVADIAKESADDIKKTTEDAAAKATDQANEAKDKAAGAFSESKEKAEGKAREIDAYSKETFGSVVDKAAEVREKSLENAEKLGEQVLGQHEKNKEAIEGAFGEAAKTAQKIQDAVLGKSDE